MLVESSDGGELEHNVSKEILRRVVVVVVEEEVGGHVVVPFLCLSFHALPVERVSGCG